MRRARRIGRRPRRNPHRRRAGLSVELVDRS
jgi:hypothetical protein